MVSMATLLQNLKYILIGRDRGQEQAQPEPVAEPPPVPGGPELDIAPNDPLVAYLLSAPVAVEIDKLNLDSPALRTLKGAEVKMVVPLVSQGELVGLLNLGPRRSERDYSIEDRGLLNTLATQAAPAVRVAQLVREQQAQVRARERIEQELRVARLIQQTLLPRDVPDPDGWKLSAYWTPARAVGGDFYDFLTLNDGRLGIVIGDVTDKGIPAALVMATTRSILRAAAQEENSPGKVLERTNNLLYPDIPAKMFVTCLYAILDPHSGQLRYANAGHDLPYQRRQGQVTELRAVGMPLGLMPDMRYEEKETRLKPGESVLFYSDGLVEAHNGKREMFGIPRLMKLLEEPLNGTELIDFLLNQLKLFTGTDLEQEDDVTMVLLQRFAAPEAPECAAASADQELTIPAEDDWQLLAAWNVPSEAGNERQIMKQVNETIQSRNLSPMQLEQLKTAVSEAAMNAIEHGNHYQADIPVEVQVLSSKKALAVRITDQGGHQPIATTETPDLEAKLAELQTPRGWGLFLIENLVDEMHVSSDDAHHTIELVIYFEKGNASHVDEES